MNKTPYFIHIFSNSNNSLQAANNTFAGCMWPAGCEFETTELNWISKQTMYVFIPWQWPVRMRRASELAKAPYPTPWTEYESSRPQHTRWSVEHSKPMQKQQLPVLTLSAFSHWSGLIYTLHLLPWRLSRHRWNLFGNTNGIRPDRTCCNNAITFLQILPSLAQINITNQV